MDAVFEPLKQAAYQGDVAEFADLLEQSPELLILKSADAHPDLFQFIAVEGGLGKIPQLTKFVDLMIKWGASLDSPLVAAASVNSFEIVDALMNAGADIEACKPWTALEEALYWSHHKMALHLIETHQAPIKSLRAAAQLEEMELLAEFFTEDGTLKDNAGDVVYPFGHESDTPMATINQACFLALRNERYQAAQFLFECGAELNTIALGHHERCTPLHQAVYLDKPDMIDWLLERGARADLPDPRYNQTAVQWARHFKRENLALQMEKRRDSQNTSS